MFHQGYIAKGWDDELALNGCLLLNQYRDSDATFDDMGKLVPID